MIPPSAPNAIIAKKENAYGRMSIQLQLKKICHVILMSRVMYSGKFSRDKSFAELCEYDFCIALGCKKGCCQAN